MSRITPQRGIALYVAVLIAGIVTFISFAVSNTAFQQVQLAQTGELSQYAFYAGNSGVECLMYWDVKSGDVQFATSSESVDGGQQGDGIPGNDTSDPYDDREGVSCNGADNTHHFDVVEHDNDSATTTFFVDNFNGEPSGDDVRPATCAELTIGKHTNPSDDDEVTTIVEVSGRTHMSNCRKDQDGNVIADEDDPNIPDSSVERSIRVVF